jgi:hypothetical protein
VLAARDAAAQECHPVPTTGEVAGIGVDAALVVARFDEGETSGSYAGAIVGARWLAGRLGAGFALPAYRVDRGETSQRALGDLGVSGQWTLYDGGGGGDVHDHAADDHAAHLAMGARGGRVWRAGVAASVTLPTGDADAGTGMGHVMVMPGAWGSVELGAWSATLAGSWGQALGGADAHQHHGGAIAPIVHPMNRSELAGTLRVGVRLGARTDLHASLSGAAPLVDEGVARGGFELGAHTGLGAWRVGVVAGGWLADEASALRGGIDVGFGF